MWKKCFDYCEKCLLFTNMILLVRKQKKQKSKKANSSLLFKKGLSRDSFVGSVSILCSINYLHDNDND